MRILRGQSNLEVSSKGFAPFVVGLIIATFIGGALRTVLSSDQVHRRIVTELKNRFPTHEFQVGQTEVLLSRGLWPGLGLRIRDLTFKQDVCGKLSFVLTVPQATLPLDLWNLWRGKFRVNHVEIDNGGLHIDYHDCALKAVAGGVPPATSAKDAEQPGKTPHAVVLPNLDWVKAAEFMDGLDLRGFAITYQKNPTWKLVLNTAYLNLSNDMHGRMQMDVEKSLPFGTINHPVEVEIHGEGRTLDCVIRSDFKEGNVRLTGNVDLDNKAARVKLAILQVPIKELMSEIFQMGLVDQDLKLKGTWLSGAFSWEGLLTNYAAAPIVVQGVRLEGAYGHAELEHAEMWWGNPDYFKNPAHIKVEKLALQPVIEAMGRQVLPAVLPHLGAWTGTVDFSGPGLWHMDGFLDGTEIIFANQSMRGKQIIDRVHTQVSRTKEAIQGHIDETKVHDGEFAGAIDFILSGDTRSGRFQARIDKLLLSPAIQNILVGGSLGAVSGTGTGELSAGELARWEGEFEIPELSGEGWQAELLQMRTNYSNQTFHLDGKVKTVTTESGWRLYSQMISVNPQLPAHALWRGLNFKVEIQKQRGVLHSVGATEATSGRMWKSHGTWLRDGDFNGILEVGSGKKEESFALHGEKGGLIVTGR